MVAATYLRGRIFRPSTSHQVVLFRDMIVGMTSSAVTGNSNAVSSILGHI